MGALRLARPAGGGEAFVAAESLPVPPLARLRDLEHWAREAEEGLGEELSEEERWLAMLVAPGSSLGGVRPKASYLDGGSLWMAKFPSREDRHDVGAWQHVVARLTEAAGNRLSATQAKAVVDEVTRTVRGWRDLAKEAGLQGDELERIGSAFAAA